MSKVDTEGVWTVRLAVFVVFQFVVYMSVFYLFYRTNSDLMSNGFWRLTTIFAIIMAFLSSKLPVDLKYDIRVSGMSGMSGMSGARNYGYFPMVASVCFVVIYLLFICLFRWSFSLSSVELGNAASIYLICIPLSAMFFSIFSVINES